MTKFKCTFLIFLLAYFSRSQQILEPQKENQIIVKNNSDYLEIPLFFRKTIISIKSLSSSTILISDKLGLDINKNCYSSDAQHCQKIILEKDNIYNTTISQCLEKLFLYSSNKEPNQTEFIIIINYVTDEVCSLKNESPDCAQLSIDECSKRKCDGCKILTCEHKIPFKHSTTSFSFCVAQDALIKNGLKYCLNDEDFFHDKPESQIARFEVCENEAGTFWHKFFALTAVAFIILSAILITTMIYYRYKLDKFKKPPFNPPKCCPSFLFPEQKDEKKELIEDLSEPHHSI